MKVPRRAVELALALVFAGSSAGAAQLPERSITSIASSGNHIIYEENVDRNSSSTNYNQRSVRIQADVPVTIQRHARWSEDGNPIVDGDEVIIVTSDCDTSETSVLPVVNVTKDEGGNTAIRVSLGVATDEALQMPFLGSTSYNASWYEYGCGVFRGDAAPSPFPAAEINTPNPNGFTPTPAVSNPVEQPSKAPTSDTIESVGQSTEIPVGSAAPIRTLILGSLLWSAVYSNPPSKSRELDTCTYNVEVLVAGCGGG